MPFTPVTKPDISTMLRIHLPMLLPRVSQTIKICTRRTLTNIWLSKNGERRAENWFLCQYVVDLGLCGNHELKRLLSQQSRSGKVKSCFSTTAPPIGLTEQCRRYPSVMEGFDAILPFACQFRNKQS
jgi:hypothetical protein